MMEHADASYKRVAARHKARQIRARIVELARAFREACGQLGAASLACDRGEGTLADLERCAEVTAERQEALFGALEELEMLEMLEEGQ